MRCESPARRALAFGGAGLADGAAGCRRLGAVGSAMEVVERGLAGLSPLAPVPPAGAEARTVAGSEAIGIAFATPVAVVCPGASMAAEDGDHDQPEHDEQDQDRHEEADDVARPERAAVGPGSDAGRVRPRTGGIARAVCACGDESEKPE